MDDKKAKIISVSSRAEVISYAVSLAMAGLVKRGIMSQQAELELAADSDKAYMAIMSGNTVSLDEGGHIKVEPRHDEQDDEPADTLVIGD